MHDLRVPYSLVRCPYSLDLTESIKTQNFHTSTFSSTWAFLIESFPGRGEYHRYFISGPQITGLRLHNGFLYIQMHIQHLTHANKISQGKLICRITYSSVMYEVMLKIGGFPWKGLNKNDFQTIHPQELPLYSLGLYMQRVNVICMVDINGQI